MRRVALVTLACVACGDNVDDPRVERSGSRLRLARYVYPDGTAQLERRWFHDDARDERCTPRQWSDGATYCTPDAGDALFTDAQCATAVGRVASGGSVPAYFATTFQLGSEPAKPSRLFAASSTPTPAPGNVWELRDGFCLGPSAPDAGYDYYELGVEVTSATLARVRHGEPLGDGRLATSYATSDDGLNVAASLYDRELAVECAIDDRPNAETTVCVPRGAALISYFHDAQCSEPVIAVPGAELPALAYLRDPLTHCTSYFGLGAQLTAPPLYERIGGNCVEVSPPSGVRLFAAGAEIVLVEIERTREAGDRLQPIAPASLEDLLYDRELATDCRRDESDLRCVPVSHADVQTWFADAGCQTALPLAFVPSGSCDGPAPYARGDTDVFPVLAPYTQTIFELSTGDRCDPYAPPAPLVAHAIGAAIARDTLPAAQLAIDR